MVVTIKQYCIPWHIGSHKYHWLNRLAFFFFKIILLPDVNILQWSRLSSCFHIILLSVVNTDRLTNDDREYRGYRRSSNRLRDGSRGTMIRPPPRPRFTSDDRGSHSRTAVTVRFSAIGSVSAEKNNGHRPFS